MKHINLKKLIKTKRADIVIVTASVMLLYLLISLYFTNHTFFNTFINGVDVSLKAHTDVDCIIKSYIQDYSLELVERDGETEVIRGQDIGMRYNEKNNISKVYRVQRPSKWITSLLKVQNYNLEGLFFYDKARLENKISALKCLNEHIIEPQSVSFKYSNDAYEVVPEVWGNKIHKDIFVKAIEVSLLEGKTRLNLDEKKCYENPKYTSDSEQTYKTKNLLDKYVSTKITYIFGHESEVVDGDIISGWLSIDENLEVIIDEKAVSEYVLGLCRKYDTVGKARKFKTSTNKIVEVSGGFYGWKINRAAETKALLENIKRGEVIEREPLYTQKAISRGEDDIGNTYLEINITKQYLWFYKDGKLITQGSVVTGNPLRGCATKTGVYMINYKQEGSVLRGPNYEAEVTYWMPFNGNIGLHDANWRYGFGGVIYRRNGSHGCVNAPVYLAKKVFENIEEGTPVICYEEEKEQNYFCFIRKD